MAIDPIPAEKQACKNCRFSKDTATILKCHRLPPHPIPMQNFFPGFWPEVCEEDWCGEWQERF